MAHELRSPQCIINASLFRKCYGEALTFRAIEGARTKPPAESGRSTGSASAWPPCSSVLALVGKWDVATCSRVVLDETAQEVFEVASFALLTAVSLMRRILTVRTLREDASTISSVT